MFNITIESDELLSYKLGRNAEYGVVEVQPYHFPQNALQYIFDYGLRQVLNDAIATKVDKDNKLLSADQIRNKALAKLEALLDGSLRTRGDAIASDPYEAEAFKEMKRHLLAVLTKAGMMRDIPKGTQDRFMFAVNRMQAKAGKTETSEREYLLDRLATPIGVTIAERARKAVDDRRALEAEVEGLI